MDEVAGMRLFAAIVGAGSLSEAARRLGLSPATVSRRVDALERGMGVPLLRRSTRSLRMTEAGELFLRRAEAILDEIGQLRDAVLQLDASPRGTLRVSAPLPLGRLRIAPALPAFLRQHPDLRVDLTLTDRFVDVLDEGIDVAVRIGTLPDSSLIARRLGDHGRAVCAAPAYLQGQEAPRAPADLEAHACLIYAFHQGEQVWRFRTPGSAAAQEVRVTGPFRTNDAETLQAAVVGGLGIGLLPLWMIRDDLDSGRLVPLLGRFEASTTGFGAAIHAVYPPGRRLSAKVRAFVDFLVAEFGDPTDREAFAAAGLDPRGRHGSKLTAAG